MVGIPMVLLVGSMNMNPIQFHLFLYHQDIRDQGNFLLNDSDSKSHQIQPYKGDHFDLGKILYHYLVHRKDGYNLILRRILLRIKQLL